MSGKSPQVFLVGVVHRDPQGYSKLFSCLECIAPHLITVEVSPAALCFRWKHSPRLLEQLYEHLERVARARSCDPGMLLACGPIAEVRAQLELPFEYRAARDYAASAEVPVIPADSSRHSRSKLPRFHSLVSPPNLEALLRLEEYRLEDKVAKEYARAARILENGKGPPPTSIPFSARFGREWRRREERMALVIQRALRYAHRKGGGTLVHVGGWMHLLEGHLYGRLKNARPRRILLK